MKRSKHAIYRVFLTNKLVLFVNLCVLCFICGTEIERLRSFDIGIFGYLISIFTNHYYILYCMVPIVLIMMAKYMKSISDIERIRYHDGYQQIRVSSIHFSGFILIYLFLQFVVAFIVGSTAFPLSVNSSPMHVQGYDELIALFNNYIDVFSNSMVASLALLGYFVFGFLVLLSLLSYINQRYGYKKVILLCLLVYIFTIIGFKTDLKMLIPPICFNNYLLLHHSLFVNGPVRFLSVIAVGVAVILFSFGIKKYMHKSILDEITISRRDVLIALGCVSLLCIIEFAVGFSTGALNTRDFMLNMMSGNSIEYSSFVSWTKITILYFIPVFFVGMAQARIKKYQEAPIVIRFESYRNLENRLLIKYTLFLVIYIAFIFTLGSILYQTGDRSELNTEFLAEAFGYPYTINIWVKFMLIFSVHLFLIFTIFISLSKYIGETISMILLVVGFYLGFILPNYNMLNLGFGLLKYFELLKTRNGVYPYIILSMIIVVVVYYFVKLSRREKNVGY